MKEQVEYDFLKKLKYIFITHEHPDHLHWPTLKYIKENCEQNINVIFVNRGNKNVVDNLRKMGFLCGEAKPNVDYDIKGFIKFANFPTGHDSAYVFTVDDRVILNQNDCHLSPQQCTAIKRKYPKIDLWWIQFSLAGYYANQDDHHGLTAAKEQHKDLIKKYFNIFRPKTMVPFASFVYFCKEHNSFLNKWANTIEEISKCLENIPMQIVYYGDEVKDELDISRNMINIEKWKQIYNNSYECLSHKNVSKEEILYEANKFLVSIKNVDQRFRPQRTTFEFYDKDELFVLDCKRDQCFFSKKESISNISGILPSEEFHFFLKYPWGADTLNITSCFEIKNKVMWRKILEFKDMIYAR